MTAQGEQRRAAVVGTGLIGGSVALALQAAGWHVTGSDIDPARAQRALQLGVINSVGSDPDAEITFLAVPVSSVADAAREALRSGGVVTDVGSVKAPLVAAVQDAKFVGGHPMAGSEAIGVDGARGDLFDATTWVLTPTANTDPAAQALVHSVVRSFGAEVLTLDAAQHDHLVATVSHVPHLTAATLMDLAATQAEEHSAVLRLAAGGFRDMTRIAAGDPGMWLDICTDNREAILGVLDDLLDSLGVMRGIVATGDSEALEQRLRLAQQARRSLPTGAPAAEQLAEIRVSIVDQPGELASVTALATELGVNVYDVEVAHTAGDRRGRLILVVDADRAASLAEALRSQSRVVSVHELA
ncbi:MAG: prephenate dehydrogenase/arogenate dehydrogenase family protein [Actinobacteria bacterium]|uniref:Prephenate dehydrogenase n=1 Tax=freshwater metagenome TaxID=449393 RepID=A0A6J6PLG3_9ZZZZ|nr:prephenate dehydrogenase/arogenate dehydrogenase family protein [Actinomycetota bacterium]